MSSPPSGRSLSPVRVLVPRPPAARRRPASLIEVALDAAQLSAIRQPAGGGMLVLGEAGHGKTTVALHRLAHLWKVAPGSRRPRAAVVVPTEGLTRLLQPLLRRLGVDVAVLTYDRWAAAQARRAFRSLPRESETTPPSVMRVKRDPALRLALEVLASRTPGVLDEDVDGAAASRRRRALVSRGDLQHLFGDRRLLEHVAEAGGIPPRAVEDVLDRTRVQLGPTAEEEFAHVTDRRRLMAVDGRTLDWGTATEHAHTVDVEDYAVLFELDRLRAERRGLPPTAPRAHDLLVIDEAQEFAPLELALLGRSVAPDGTLIVAGDADQQTDETSVFPGWEAAMRELGQPDHATITLEVGYRCPPPVVNLARCIRAGATPGRPLAFAPPLAGAGVAMVGFEDERGLATWIAREAEVLMRRDIRASLAVLCRSPWPARRLTELLRTEIPARLVFDGRFLPRGPLQVSTVDEVKGLEFDFVIVADASAHAYPDDPAARRAMYVAVTRARHQAVVAHVGPRSPILP
jgi:hypothetical protein